MTNQFTALYKKLPTSKLLEIIENRKDYQPLAIETAKFELAGRQDIEDAKNDLKEKIAIAQQKKLADDQKRQQIKDKASKVLEYADPLVEKTPERSVLILTILLLLVFILKSIGDFSFLIYTFQNFADLDTSGLLFLIEYFYLPLTIFFVWRKSKRGWTMLLIWLIYQCAFDCFGLYMCFKLSGIDSPLIQFMPRPNISTYLLMLSLHGGLIYFIFKPTIKVLFEDKKVQTLEPET